MLPAPSPRGHWRRNPVELKKLVKTRCRHLSGHLLDLPGQALSQRKRPLLYTGPTWLQKVKSCTISKRHHTQGNHLHNSSSKRHSYQACHELCPQTLIRILLQIRFLILSSISMHSRIVHRPPNRLGYPTTHLPHPP
jgi:hypothetical protein